MNIYNCNDTHTHIMVANIVDMSPSGHSEILNAEYPIRKCNIHFIRND